MRPAVAVGVVAVLVALSAGATTLPASAQEQGTVVGNPSVQATAPDNRLVRGERQSLGVVVANSGELVRGGPETFEDRVTAARAVSVSVATDRLTSPLADAVSVESGATLLGSLPGSAAQRVNLSLAVGADLPPGQYSLPVRIEYEYTTFVRYGTGQPEYNDAARTVVLQVPVVVEPRPRLAVSNVETRGVAPGDTGELAFTVTNTGEEPARAVGLSLTVDDVAVRFGTAASAGPTTRLFLGTLAPGASRRVVVTVGAYSGTTPGRYLAALTAAYTEPGGFEWTQTDLRAGVRVLASNATVAAPDPGVARSQRVRDGTAG